jgi:hypothetical protein
MAVFRIEKTKNYTLMSNHHLRNPTLTLKAKGLLSQMLSLPEKWDYTLAGLSAINKESVDAIRTAIWELEKAGYILRRQLRDGRGKMAATEYIIYEEPQEAPTEPKSPLLDFPISDNPTTENPIPENPTQSIKEQLNKEKSKTDVSSTQSYPIQSPRVREVAVPKTDGMGMDAVSIYQDVFKDNIEYDILMQRHPYDRETLSGIVDLMLETVCTAKKTLRVAGDDYPSELVKSKLMKLNSQHIEYVFPHANFFFQPAMCFCNRI